MTTIRLAKLGIHLPDAPPPSLRMDSLAQLEDERKST